jgi:hypothetical protein
MKYDTTVHLPSQIDALIGSFQKADIPGMERSLDNIKTIIKDKKFRGVLNDYQLNKLDKIDELQKKAALAIKTINTSKSFSDLYIDIDEIKNDFIQSMEGLERDYWNNVKEFITLYIHEEPKEEPDDSDDG